MINKFEAIKNIGNFEDYKASGDVTLKKMSFIYGENGSGKTTLARILYSLSLGDGSIIQRHKRIGSTSNSEVQIKDNTNSPIRFDGSSWNRKNPNVEVFDSHFVANNIYVGFEVNSEHHKRLYRFVVGDTGVRLIKKIEKVKTLIDTVNYEATTKAELIKASADGIDAVEVCAIQNQEDIEANIEAKEKELILAKGQERILNYSFPQPIKASIESIDERWATSILQTSVEGIGQEYLIKVHQQIDELSKAGLEQSTIWLHSGVQYLKSIQEQNCPFCGQSIDGNELIEGYNQYFSERYTKVATDAKELYDQLLNINAEAYLLLLDSQYKQIEESLNVWNTYIGVKIPLPSLNTAEYHLYEKLQSLKGIVSQKVSNPVVSCPVDVLKQFSQTIADITGKVDEINQYVKEYVVKITDLRSKIRPVPEVERELRGLILVKKRYEEPLMGICDRYLVLARRIEHLRQINKDLQARQKSITNAMFNEYGKKTNEYLQNVFLTRFKIEDVKDGGFRGKAKEPNLDYVLTFDGFPIILGDGGTLNNSFKNVLSEGDKNTLAFSFFLAKLSSESDLAEKIVVFDDPLTSLDLNRRNATIEQLVWLYSHCKQVIVLSHNLHFLIDLNGRRQIKKNEKKTLRIVNSRGESYIQEFELKKEWIDNYKKAITTMNNFVASPDPSNQEEAINSIRLSLETFLKLKFCRFITDQDQTFGDIVHQLEKSECSFVNADRQGVINKLNNLVAVSWRTHHGSVEERDLYTEQSFSMTEAINYVEMTLRLLEKEL